MTLYRIVRDSFAGFEVQEKPFKWWPWWHQSWTINTSGTLESAKRKIAYKTSCQVVWQSDNDKEEVGSV